MSGSFRSGRRRLALTAVFALLAAAGLMTVLAGSASAAPATRHVALTGTDTGDCIADACRSIQYAVDQANPGDTVSVGAGAYHEAVQIRISLTLIGAGSSGSGRTTVDGPTECCADTIHIDGVDSDVVPEVTVEDLDISGNAGGRGVFVDTAIGHIVSSVVAGNTEEGVAVNQQQVAAERNADPATTPVVPSATISQSLVAGNGSNENAAGVVVYGAGQVDIDHSAINGNGAGGVVIEDGTGHIDTSTLDRNIGAAFVLDGFDDTGSFTNSTASNTVPFSSTEGGPAFGGGLLSFSGTLNVDTSTVANNSGQGILSEAGFVHVNNSTISGTKAADNGLANGGVVVDNVFDLARNTAHAQRFVPTRKGQSPVRPNLKPNAAVQPGVALRATIDADNTTVDDCSGPVQDAGYNLASDTSCAFTASTSIQNGHAKLGPLTDNGGPTATMEPKKGSDALDRIPSGQAGCDPASQDQRGAPRLAGAKCDIGAVEVAQTAVAIAPDALPNGKVGDAYHQVVTATGGLGAPYEWSLASGTLPPGLTFSSGGVISGTPTQAGTFHFVVSVDDPTLKAYTIVIDAAAVLPTSQPPLANTGTNVRPVAYLGGTAVGLGLLMLLTSGALGRWYRRYIRQH